MNHWVYILLGICVLAIIGSLSKKTEHGYSASFGRPGQFLNRFNHGFAATGSKAISRQLSHTNLALFGPTGSGKSSTIIISSAVSLARAGSSMIFNDISGELWDAVSNYLKSRGYLVLCINWAAPEQSEKFNCLAFVRTIPDIQKLALLIIKNTIGETKGSDPFWQDSATMLLSLMIRYCVYYAEPQYRTMQNVLRLVERFASDGPSVDRLFAATGDETLMSTYKALVAMSDKTLQSVIATLRTALNLWIDPAVCQVTSDNTIRLEDLRERPVAIFLKTPQQDLGYYKPITAIFLQTLFNFLLSERATAKTRSVFFILDEFATYTFPDITTVIATCRKSSVGILICMQDEQALISRYGQAEAHQIKTNCGCQIYLKGQPLSTAKELSQILGKYTYQKEGSSVDRVRELMTPDEIRMSDIAIILINNQAPLLCKMVPYHKNLFLRHLINKPPVEPSRKPLVEPPLIKFDE